MRSLGHGAWEAVRGALVFWWSSSFPAGGRLGRHRPVSSLFNRALVCSVPGFLEIGQSLNVYDSLRSYKVSALPGRNAAISKPSQWETGIPPGQHKGCQIIIKGKAFVRGRGTPPALAEVTRLPGTLLQPVAHPIRWKGTCGWGVRCSWDAMPKVLWEPSVTECVQGSRPYVNDMKTSKTNQKMQLSLPVLFTKSSKKSFSASPTNIESLIPWFRPQECGTPQEVPSESCIHQYQFLLKFSRWYGRKFGGLMLEEAACFLFSHSAPK